MIIFVSPNEFEPEFRNLKVRDIFDIHIDYYTNAIHGYFESEEIIFVRFEKFGIQLDNRRNGYTSSVGEAGLIIDIKENIKNENIQAANNP
jgi:hypothetical protein